jgi:hypothetical protein
MGALSERAVEEHSGIVTAEKYAMKDELVFVKRVIEKVILG